MTRAVVDLDVSSTRKGLLVHCVIRTRGSHDLLTATGWTRRSAVKAAERALNITILGYAALTAKREYENLVDAS